MASSRKRTPPEESLSARLAQVLAAAGAGRAARLCAALSGGVDSVVLLHLLAAQREECGYMLTAAHVHHGLSPNADEWRDFCCGLCDSLRVPLQVFHVEVARDAGAGLEAAAREARLAALGRIDADWLVFGHHLDDQAETLLFRLLRGAGVHGAAAMPAIEYGRPGRLRPLLAVRRARLAAYAAQHRLRWVEDESNADWRFTRNRLRHDILPRLEAVFPAAVTTLARAADHFREADGLLDDLAAADREACGGDTLNLSAALALSDARLRNLLRREMRRAGQSLPSAAWLCEAVRQLRAVAGRPLFLRFDGIVLCAYRDRLWLERNADSDSADSRVWRGEACLPWWQGTVCFRAGRGAGLSLSRLERAAEVVLTTRWSGLRMRLAPNRPLRSFKNLCQEAAISSWLRGRLPVLSVDGEAAWIAGIGVSADFAAGDDESSVDPLWLR